ncbi:sulfotransferase [Roseobacter sp. GAI101]|uniref:sulfotransferase n=1 Tax=Roseobacter sp. (strain GAI101) TaxID=391589 RepID=UPI0018DC4454|nr:sulfotransferase [Roseobacter sp. GAI101]
MHSETAPTYLHKNPVIVLGMHKSGTTLISETLHASGIAMIDTTQEGGYDDGNKMEREATRCLNIALLGCEDLESVRITQSLDVATTTLDQRAHGRAVLETASRNGAWGFKDPRTLLTYDYWEDLIGTPQLVGIFRDPAEVFRHYARRPWWRWIRQDPMYIPAAMHAWCVYNDALLTLARRRPDMLLLDYAAFMSSPLEMSRLEKHLGVPLVDRRIEGMRRAVANRTKAYVIMERVERSWYGLDASHIQAELLALRSAQIKMEEHYA